MGGGDNLLEISGFRLGTIKRYVGRCPMSCSLCNLAPSPQPSPPTIELLGERERKSAIHGLHGVTMFGHWTPCRRPSMACTG